MLFNFNDQKMKLPQEMAQVYILIRRKVFFGSPNNSHVHGSPFSIKDAFVLSSSEHHPHTSPRQELVIPHHHPTHLGTISDLLLHAQPRSASLHSLLSSWGPPSGTQLSSSGQWLPDLRYITIS